MRYIEGITWRPRETKFLFDCSQEWELYSPWNDPDPEMIPNLEMIPKSTPKFDTDPEMIPKLTPKFDTDPEMIPISLHVDPKMIPN